ncbi:cilia- and flagella-associated protein 77 isoform X3 [Cynoglossus semilaevis]|nr:cilia- and flagella-associated protein 77 isoform X3 [Cynoglossus semilaevis]XP_024909128.1 cilia- and flagella-associated protein 77 isoform X3 [Cynoglossus semilaevis]
MSTPRLGVVRDSMSTNPLLIKASLGQTKTRGLSLPGPEYTFGSSSSLQDGGVAEVLSGWRVQLRHENSASHRPSLPDFVSLNRDAAKAGVVTCKELNQYRAKGGGAKTKHHPPKQPAGGVVVPDITFGVTTRSNNNRAPSPLSDLLAHQYARRWVDEQLSRNQTSSQKQQHRIKPGSETRTSLLRRSRALPVTQPLLRPKRYAQVPPALETFRDQETRLRALRTHESETGVQDGSLGSGV